MIWVLDASVAVRWFLKDESHPNADAVLQRLIDAPQFFAIPELFSFEVYAVLCRVHPSGHKAFVEGIVPILNGGILRQPMTKSLATGANRFVRKGLTGYDACYAALAREMKGKWLTFDRQAHGILYGEGISHDLTMALPRGWS
jgi:predicted nucleic acid-binding protein